MSPTLPPLRLSARAREELGFAEIEEIWSNACVTPFGREALLSDPFPSSHAAVIERMEEVLEAAALCQQGTVLDFRSIRDVRGHLDLLDKDAVLGPLEVLEIAQTLDALARIRDVLENRGDEVPRLLGRVRALEDERPFARRVYRSIDEQGQITDEASPALAELRARVRSMRVEAQDRLEHMIREYDDVGVLRERNFTLRNDRYVLPVRAEFQGRVEGIVHDASQTGQTVFIEPRQVLEVGNRIKIARAAALEEETRILREFSEEIKWRAPQLLADLERAGAVEAGFARGLFAARTESEKPQFIHAASTTQRLELVGARHPLLAWQVAEAEARGTKTHRVIPNDIGFGESNALIITGPNAGGKTVALKTAGLAALLVRAGMPIPASSESRVPLVAAVFSTIGDAQNLNEALSSFSGHLVALRQILEDVKSTVPQGNVLCLLDELASGTDPAQGAALAQAFLETLVAGGAWVVATTHYERLKRLGFMDGEAQGRYRNASVALDPETHKPTFLLRLDQVGTSNALDAARRYGLPAPLLDRAESLLDRADRDFQSLLGKLMGQQSDLNQRIEQVERERNHLEMQREKLQRRLDEVEAEAARLRREGVRAFENEIQSARKVVAQAIERAQKGADARELNELSHALRQEEKKAATNIQKSNVEPDWKSEQVIQVGDRVEVKTLPGTQLEVLEVNGEEIVLARGAMKMRVERKLVRRARGSSAPSTHTSQKRKAKPKLEHVPSEPRSSDNTLDIRGERSAEAVEILEAFLDRLLQQNRTRAWVLHGHGTGALKRSVREALSNSRYVQRYAAAESDDGGDACTFIELGTPTL